MGEKTFYYENIACYACQQMVSEFIKNVTALYKKHIWLDHLCGIPTGVAWHAEYVQSFVQRQGEREFIACSCEASFLSSS
jgi:hypothetical protein